jgi:hypothetical protein
MMTKEEAKRVAEKRARGSGQFFAIIEIAPYNWLVERWRDVGNNPLYEGMGLPCHVVDNHGGWVGWTWGMTP